MNVCLGREETRWITYFRRCLLAAIDRKIGFEEIVKDDFAALRQMLSRVRSKASLPTDPNSKRLRLPIGNNSPGYALAPPGSISSGL